MSPTREWKTEQEIRGIVVEEMRDALRGQNQLLEHVLREAREARVETRDMLTAQNKVVDKIADSAQVPTLLASEMIGNPEMGVVGFMPKTLERLTALEEGRELDRKSAGRRDERLERLEKKQDRALRFLGEICKAWFVGSNGALDWQRLIPTVIGAATVVHAVLRPTQTFWQIAWLAHWMHLVNR